jgi:hypothetical protein
VDKSFDRISAIGAAPGREAGRTIIISAVSAIWAA